jgi:hypothetical protein
MQGIGMPIIESGRLRLKKYFAPLSVYMGIEQLRTT